MMAKNSKETEIYVFLYSQGLDPQFALLKSQVKGLHVRGSKYNSS